MFDHVYKTFYKPIGPDCKQGDIVRDQLTMLVNKAFLFVEAGESGVTLDGLRRIIKIRPPILECFQPLFNSTIPPLATTTMSASESRVIDESAGHADQASLHLLDTPTRTHMRRKSG